MARRLTFRQFLLSTLALYYDVSQKEIAVGARLSEPSVSQYLRSRKRKREIGEEAFELLLKTIPCRPAAVAIVTACFEDLETLDRTTDLSDEELAEIERGVQGAARLIRQILTAGVRRSRGTAPGDQALKLCMKLCDESTEAASRDLETAAVLARLAAEAAEEVEPEGLRIRVTGVAAAYGSNVQRVTGELLAAETSFAEAKRHWDAGSDPDGVLDPGRILDLEGSLRRDQRRFDDALACLDEAVKVGWSPERSLINKGFTLEVMGEYERAVETLLQATPLVEAQSDQRLQNILRFNLAVNYCHTHRYREAAELVKVARPLATETGDDLALIRMTWLDGRIAAGLSRPQEALALLAEARREFARRNMAADAALALLEEAALLLDQGRTAEVKELAQELAAVLKSKGVHREALAALQLFQEAAEREAATAELARRVLGYLFRARYDEGLHFMA